ncbi:MAG: hypothetical protein J6A19_04155 [Oscillospiraceae bacterium]|nr:hypothetical protein [Oscillospiraceae bacterium]
MSTAYISNPISCSELWQLNDYFRVEIPVIGDYEALNVTVRVLVSSGLSKSYEICQSNNVIGSGQVSGMSTVSFTGDVENGKLSFDMYMLDIYDDDIDADKQISPDVCLQEITVNQIENF